MNSTIDKIEAEMMKRWNEHGEEKYIVLAAPGEFRALFNSQPFKLAKVTSCAVRFGTFKVVEDAAVPAGEMYLAYRVVP
jgi:hypothetical protein